VRRGAPRDRAAAAGATVSPAMRSGAMTRGLRAAAPFFCPDACDSESAAACEGVMTTHIALSLAFLAAGAAAQTTLLHCDFENGLPPQVVPGTGAVTGVQGFAGLGPAGGAFAGSFLRSETGNTVTITLANLPPHNAIQLDFLFAAIDSLDGTGSYPGGDYFAIEIDGNTFFRESFANALSNQFQSYVPPAGVELARRVDLGFSGPGSFFTDSAYWLGADPSFLAIGHTSSTLTIALRIEGGGIQSLNDESWALDNLTIRALNTANPGTVVAYGQGCGPTLSVFGSPRIGTNMAVHGANLPVGAVAAGFAIGTTGLASQPLSLGSLGAPGCFVLHDASISAGVPMLVQGTAADFVWPIPSLPAAVGLQTYLQVWVVAPNTNALNVTTTNALRVTFGQ
jgi:hypothetical protein